MKVSEREILDGNIVKVIFLLGWPVIISSLLEMGYNMADTFWLGRWGNPTDSMSAVAAMQVSWPLIFVMISISLGFGIAGISLISQYTGAEKIKKAAESAGQLLSLGIIVGIFLSVFGIIITPYLLGIMNLTPDVERFAFQYMVIIFLGLPFMFISAIFISVLRSYGDPVTPMLVDGLGVGLNIILDPILINGYFGAPELGIAGAAIATVVTRGVASALAIYLLFRGVAGLKIKLHYLKPKMFFVKKIFRIGLPASLGQFSTALGFFILMWIISSLPNSTVALAAYGVGDRVMDMAFIVINGIGTGMATIIGHSLGAEKYERAEETFKTAVKITFLILLFETLIIVPLRYQIIGFFTPKNPEVINEGASFLLISGIGIPFFGIISTVEGLYEGSGHTIPIMIMDIVRLWGFRVLFSFIFGILLGFGSTGVWISMALSNIITGFLALAFYLLGSWRRRVIE